MDIHIGYILNYHGAIFNPKKCRFPAKHFFCHRARDQNGRVRVRKRSFVKVVYLILTTTHKISLETR